EDPHVRPVRERPARLRVAARLGDLREPDRGVDRQGLPGQGLDGQPVARGEEQAPQVLHTHGPTVFVREMKSREQSSRTPSEVSDRFNSDTGKDSASNKRRREDGGRPVSGDKQQGIEGQSPPAIKDLERSESTPTRSNVGRRADITMSCVPVLNDGDEVCANCGRQGSDTVKLKNCTACLLVKYCGVDCQRAHRKQHKKTCKQRAAELEDKRLYSQGHERSEGDFCPICTLPIPLPTGEHSTLNACCMKFICRGCYVAAGIRGMFDCPYCRTRYPDNDADELAMINARVSKKDPVAINLLGGQCFYGRLGLQKDSRKAVEVWTEAAELGSVEALYNLGLAHERGEGVKQDKAKGFEFFKRAAMQGHVQSRYNLGCLEGQKGNHDRALRHFLISAKMGHKNSLDTIKKMFMDGLATKEQYTQVLKGHQEAVEEMKSHDRDEAKRLRDEQGL
ncbi:hypothetical protein THAOC_07211, partial [Thalassiosira oceanica]